MSTETALKFNAVSALPAQPAEWWTVLVEGNYKHPKYGDKDGNFAITRDRLLRLHQHFQDGVYGNRVWLDLNHQPIGEQGYPGYVSDTRLVEDQGKQKLQIKPVLNEYGKLLVGDERVDSVSAEFWQKYATFGHGQVEDLLTKVALTGTPHMKNLGSITFCEMDDDDADGAVQAATSTSLNRAPQSENEPANGTYPVLLFEEAAPMANEPTTPVPTIPQVVTVPPTDGVVTLSADEVRQLREQAAETPVLLQRLEHAERSMEHAERIALGEQLLRVRGELVSQFAGLQFSDPRYKLAPALCEQLANKALKFDAAAPTGADGQVLLGEDNKPRAAERQEFVDVVRAIGEGLVALSTKGFSAETQPDADPAKVFDGLVRARMSEKNETYDVAALVLMTEQPEAAAKAIQIG